jgi:predicted enzyme related to lactoylglutathione lyase
LHTTDTAKSRAFYTELFGWNAKEDPAGHYTEFQVEGRSIAGMMDIPPERREHMPSNWLLYAMVDDCDVSMKKAAELGAQVIVPAQDIPDVGRFAVIADPTGAAIAMIKLTGHAAG